jgi:hypothetical protein
MSDFFMQEQKEIIALNMFPIVYYKCSEKVSFNWKSFTKNFCESELFRYTNKY